MSAERKAAGQARARVLARHTLECTILWTTPAGVPPEAIADTIIAVLNTIRPLAAAHGPGEEDTSPQ